MPPSTLARALGAGLCTPAAATAVAQAAAGDARVDFDVDEIGAQLAHVVAEWIRFDDGAADDGARAPAADAVRALLGALRNAVHANEANQLALLRYWDAVAALLGYLVRFERMNDPVLMPVVRVAAQLLANAFGGCAAMRYALWRRHVFSSSAPPLDAVTRLAASTDTRTSFAALACLVHAVHAHDATDFGAELVHLDSAHAILDVALTAYDADEEGMLDAVVGIVRPLFERGHAAALLRTPLQPSVLRVIADALQERVEEMRSGSRAAPLPRAAVAPLVPLLVELAAYACGVMDTHLHEDGARADLRGLVRAHIALVALLDALTSIATCGHERIDGARLAELQASAAPECAVRLLHTAHAFFPAQSPFTSAATDAPPGHALSSTGRAAPPPDRPALHALKRGAVRLLGALAFCPPGTARTPLVASVQDRVRAAGGVLDVLSATQLDENNPCASNANRHP